MREYDASDTQIQELQRKLRVHGITEEQLDLGMYAGLTYKSLAAIVDNAIALKEKKNGKT